MLATKAYAVKSPKTAPEPYVIERREPGPNDVLIEIAFCGICHSDIHQARDEWDGATFPMVPGHEITGYVRRVGKKVKKFKVGDAAGVGCFVNSCRKCHNCKDHEEQLCVNHCAFTYNSTEMDEKTPTHGGYSSQIVVDENYVLKISKKLPLERVAPLLCAGITTYSPLKRYGIRKGHRVGVIGLGGLGHMAVKIATSLGAAVTVFSTSPKKEQDAKRLGAKSFVVSTQHDATETHLESYDLIIDTVSAPHDLEQYLNMLKKDGTMVLVGVPPDSAPIHAHTLIAGRKKLTGSLIGGIKETQEMLDYCAKKKILADVEVIPVTRINEAYERTIQGDVKYRFSIDLKTL